MPTKLTIAPRDRAADHLHLDHFHAWKAAGPFMTVFVGACLTVISICAGLKFLTIGMAIGIAIVAALSVPLAYFVARYVYHSRSTRLLRDVMADERIFEGLLQDARTERDRAVARAQAAEFYATALAQRVMEASQPLQEVGEASQPLQQAAPAEAPAKLVGKKGPK